MLANYFLNLIILPKQYYGSLKFEMLKSDFMRICQRVLAFGLRFVNQMCCLSMIFKNLYLKAVLHWNFCCLEINLTVGLLKCYSTVLFYLFQNELKTVLQLNLSWKMNFLCNFKLICYLDSKMNLNNWVPVI